MINIPADIVEAQSILVADALRDTPIALSLIALLHFVVAEHSYPAVPLLVDALPSGSYLVLTHAAADLGSEESTRLA